MKLDLPTLPTGVHATTISAHLAYMSELKTITIVWADRPYQTCPRCHQPVDRTVDACPVTIDTGTGSLVEYSQQHGCGEWLDVVWRDVPGDDPTEQDILDTAAEVAELRQDRITDEVRRITADLTADLTRALARLDEPLDDDETHDDRADEVRTGNEAEPGVYLDGTTWCAWDYHPAVDGETITVYADDLRAHHQLTRQLTDAVRTVTDALHTLGVTTDGGLADRVTTLAPMWATQLLGDDDRLAARTVDDLVKVLGIPNEPTAQWWATPLGQAVVASVGHPTATTVSYGVAGAMLGISRQAISKAIGAGRLQPGTDGGVTVASIRTLARTGR